jgi:uncharacterized membrane-anchored protein YhcB (DUF1043 family)
MVVEASLALLVGIALGQLLLYLTNRKIEVKIVRQPKPSQLDKHKLGFELTEQTNRVVKGNKK